ncbi:MAG TPA: TIGR01458 family HAD-type hydrolase, partial [Gemmatimonadales bacterium]|nr:TIGR01458 family HAD-type hydrolase [Gemmatimonadales bacterium]
EALAELRRRGVPFRYVTNTTRRSRRLLAERLSGYGFEARAEEIISAPQACVALLRQRGIRRVAACVAADALEDFAEFELKSARPEVVVVGDLGDAWDFAKLNRVFLHLMEGAELIALQRDRYWLRGGALALDAGPFVAALEYATGKRALVCGKPSPEFYRTALASLGKQAVEQAKDVVMVGDDLWGDVEGAQRAGLTAWMVRTGKFRDDVVAASGIVPDRVINSVAELPGLL